MGKNRGIRRHWFIGSRIRTSDLIHSSPISVVLLSIAIELMKKNTIENYTYALPSMQSWEFLWDSLTSLLRISVGNPLEGFW